MTLQILLDATELAHAVAHDFIMRADACINRNGRFTVALTGGTTPKQAYQVMATKPYAERVDWSRVHIFFGDERCVPPDHADSNYGMAHAALLDHVAIPAQNIHRMRGEADPHAAAAEYQQLLDEIVGPSFDFMHLGMGADAHIASLFPGSAALRETSRRVCAQFAHAEDRWRITLTPVVINRAQHITFVVAGEDKAEAVARVLEGPHEPDLAPAQVVAPPSESVLWLIDEAAAGLLEHRS